MSKSRSSSCRWRRPERAAAALRKLDSDEHLIEALERVQAEVSDIARRLRQGTYFAVTDAQTSIKSD